MVVDRRVVPGAAEGEVRPAVAVGVSETLDGRADAEEARRAADQVAEGRQRIRARAAQVDVDLADVVAVEVRRPDRHVRVAVAADVAERRDARPESVPGGLALEVLDPAAEGGRLAEVQPGLAPQAVPLRVGGDQVDGAAAVDVSDRGEHRADPVVLADAGVDLGADVGPAGVAREHEDGAGVGVGAVIAGGAYRELAVPVSVAIAQRGDGRSQPMAGALAEHVEVADPQVDPGGAAAEDLHPPGLGPRHAGVAGGADRDVSEAVAVDVPHPGGRRSQLLVPEPDTGPGVGRRDAAGVAVMDPGGAVVGPAQLLGAGHQDVVEAVAVDVAGGGGDEADLDGVGRERGVAFGDRAGRVDLDRERAVARRRLHRRGAATENDQDSCQPPAEHALEIIAF